MTIFHKEKNLHLFYAINKKYGDKDPKEVYGIMQKIRG